MNIAIFDDSPDAAEVTASLIREFFEGQDRQANIAVYTEKERLLSDAQGENRIDVIFMDIMVEEEAVGIALAKEINRISRDIMIVFLTGYLSCATDIYETKHVYFVLKTQLRQRLHDVFQKIELEHARDSEEKILICTHKGKFFLNRRDILYIERDMRCSRIVCRSGEYQVSDKISDLEKLVGEDVFVRCHNSFLVNMNEIRHLDSKEIILDNGVRIPVSRARARKMEEHFLRWCNL